MEAFRKDISTISDKKVLKVLDYNNGLDGLPKSNVIKFILEGNSSVVVRPSGTEPKLKLYLSICASDKDKATIVEKEVLASLLRLGGIDEKD